MKITMVRVAAPAAMLLALPVLAGEQIKVVERPVGETTVDLGAKGDSVGDLLVFANGIFDAANKTQIGSDQGFCVRTIVGKSWECMWTLTLKAGDVAILPAGTGHQCLSASKDFLVIGAYPSTGTYDECTTSEDHERALKSIPKVGRPRKDPVYGSKGPLLKTWKSAR